MINEITIQGRLVRDAETRHIPSGTSVTTFKLANDSGFGEHKETLFIDCTAWKGAGETIAKYCNKGSMLIVSGKLKCKEWKDKEGNKRQSYEINVSDFGFCENKKSEASTARPAESYKTPVSGADFAELDEDDGDLPF